MRFLVSIAGVSRRKKQYRQPVSEFLHLPVPYHLDQAQAAVVPLVPAFPERRKLPARAAGVDLFTAGDIKYFIRDFAPAVFFCKPVIKVFQTFSGQDKGIIRSPTGSPRSFKLLKQVQAA